MHCTGAVVAALLLIAAWAAGAAPAESALAADLVAALRAGISPQRM